MDRRLRIAPSRRCLAIAAAVTVVVSGLGLGLFGSVWPAIASTIGNADQYNDIFNDGAPSSVVSPLLGGNSVQVNQRYGCTLVHEDLSAGTAHGCPQGNPYWHHGIDLSSSAHQTWYSGGDGTVVDTQYAALGIQDPGGKIVYFVHGDTYQVSKFASVGYGQALAQASSPCIWPPRGSCSGTHLHLEVHNSVIGTLDTDDINPEPWVVGWQLAGHLAPGGPVDSWGPNRLDVFVRGNDYGYWHLAGNGATFNINAWEQHLYPNGTTFESQPVAVSSAKNRIDLFGIGFDGVLYHQWWDGISWNPAPAVTGWQRLGIPSQSSLVGTPAVATWGVNRLDVFARDTAGHVWHTCTSDEINWCSWEDHAGDVTADPAVVSWGPNRLDVFARNSSNTFEHQSWGGAGWGPGPTYQDWEAHGTAHGPLFSTRPSLASWGVNRLDIFGTATDGSLAHQSWNGYVWSPTQTTWDAYGNPAGKTLTGPAAVASWTPNRVDVFARDTSGAAWHTYSGYWGSWDPLNGVLTADLAEVTWGLNRLDVFGRGVNTTLFWLYWSGSGWTTWTTLGLVTT